GRVTYHSVTDRQALVAFHELSRCEGIVPALESAHALAYLMSGAEFRRKSGSAKRPLVLACLSGRGDKDMEIVRREPTREDKLSIRRKRA
ncbi:MAG: tryptophan synthase subunit beta, partial [Candidatus Zixiibacteriota bacterium]